MLTAREPQSLKSEDEPELSERLQLWGSSTLTLCITLGLVFTSLRPLFLPRPWMVFFDDDFFYYLKIAQNLSHGAGSSFNGIVQTNGYHPLWLLILTCLSFFTSKPKEILLFAGIIAVLCGLSTYLLSRRILHLGGLAIFPASAIALLVTLYSARMLFGGMEVVLTVPLILLVLLIALQPTYWMRDWRSSALFGLAISAMVLSRLDTLILASLLLLSVAAHRTLRRELHPAALYVLALGLVPVLLYFLSNIFFFRTLLPVSSMAKQLKTGFLPSFPVLPAFDRELHNQAIFFFIFATIFLFLVLRRQLTEIQQAVYLPVLIFPFLYIGILCCRSDWPLWPWYLYPFRPALCISFLLLASWTPLKKPLQRNSVTTVLALLAIALIPVIHWDYAGRERIYNLAIDLQDFAASHQGTYAMGDVAGMFGYLLSNLVIQTEGLVMDRSFLTHIQNSEPLREVLAGYHVHYYAVISRTLPNGCFHAAEPTQAGPASPHMRAELCEPPAAVFGYPKIYLLVYDLQSGSPSAAP